MEDDLDRIASREAERVPWLTGFYFGSAGEPGLKPMVDSAMDDDRRRGGQLDACSAPTENGEPVVVRVGKYGPYLQVGEAERTVAGARTSRPTR